MPVTSYLSSPSGRKSSRRALHALSVVTGCGCVVASLALGRDILPGAVAIMTTLIVSTGGAALVGRFAERGTEPKTVNQTDGASTPERISNA